MSMQPPFPLAAVLVAVLAGTITDRTTGQPLAGVVVTVGSSHATTHDDGTYRLSNVKPGPATLSVSSDDVPPQHFSVTIGSATTHANLTVCSTTLDYNCGPPQ
jgi:protocatechuate 3,4-dioxygenase beta subunit